MYIIYDIFVDFTFLKQFKIISLLTKEYFHKELSGIQGVNVIIIPNDETHHEHPMMPHVPRVLVEWAA